MSFQQEITRQDQLPYGGVSTQSLPPQKPKPLPKVYRVMINLNRVLIDNKITTADHLTELTAMTQTMALAPRDFDQSRPLYVRVEAFSWACDAQVVSGSTSGSQAQAGWFELWWNDIIPSAEVQMGANMGYTERQPYFPSYCIYTFDKVNDVQDPLGPATSLRASYLHEDTDVYQIGRNAVDANVFSKGFWNFGLRTNQGASVQVNDLDDLNLAFTLCFWQPPEDSGY